MSPDPPTTTYLAFHAEVPIIHGSYMGRTEVNAFTHNRQVWVGPSGNPAKHLCLSEESAREFARILDAAADFLEANP